MAWRSVQVAEERLRFAVLANAEGSCLAELCRQFGITRKTGYVWRARYREGGAAVLLAERTRRPRHSPAEAPASVVAAVTAARQQRPDWGARKLGALLAAAHPELPRISLSTVHRILDRAGLIHAEDRQQIALKRFERAEPNELWQMDFKGPQGFNRASGPLSILDDHSRYLLALRQLTATNTACVKAVLTETFQQHGVPEHVLLDHGKPWWDRAQNWGWTELTVWMLRQGIHLHYCRVRHPQTQGKVERMHGALQRALRKRKPELPPSGLAQAWLDQFRQEYNEVRPHEGIGMATPSTRWQPSARKFNAAPADWSYPAEFEPHRLAQAGQLQFHGKRWEISRALRGQLVGLQVLRSRVLVYFCHVAVRELDLTTGSNLALPAQPFRSLKG